MAGYYLIWGDVYSEIEEFGKARLFWNKALTLKPDYVQAYELLFALSLDERKYGEALKYGEKLVQLEKNIFNLDRLAWAYMLLGNYAEAERVWREMGDLVSQFEDPYFAVSYKHRLAYVLWQNNKVGEAKELFVEQMQQEYIPDTFSIKGRHKFQIVANLGTVSKVEGINFLSGSFQAHLDGCF